MRATRALMVAAVVAFAMTATGVPAPLGVARAAEPASAPSSPARPYHPHTNPQPIAPNRFYGYDVEVWPTAYELAAGHRLQLRLTSSDLPTHLPGTVVFDKDRPQDARVDLLPQATNTVRLRDSFLIVSALGGEAAGPVTAGSSR